jgi:hypothetical protein
LEFNAITLIEDVLHMREVVNGALFVLCGNIAAILVYFMGRTWWECRNGVCQWREIEGIQSACVMSWVFAIISVRSGLAWLSLKMANDGLNLNPLFESTASWSLIISAFVLAIVTLRGTYIWTPPKWHNKAWAVSLGATFLFLLASEYLA